MVSGVLASVVALAAVVFIGALVAYFLLRPSGDQLSSGHSPERVAAAPSSATASDTHLVVALHAGQPLAVQLREHAHAAELTGLRPFVEFGAAWCPPSRMFGEILGDPRMVAALEGIYLIRVELDDFSGDPLMRELGVTSVPVFFELDAEGNSTGRRIDGGAWGADTIENMAQTMGPFFAG